MAGEYRPCLHRWSRGGLCVAPGCRAYRPAGTPLQPGERLHTTISRPGRSGVSRDPMAGLLSGQEAADLLGVSRRTVHQMGARGELLMVVVSGTRVGYEPSSVNSLVSSRVRISSR